MGLEFSKGQGTGNDFVLVRDPEDRLRLTARDVKLLCDRRFGIGGDGFIRVTKAKYVSGYSENHRAWGVPAGLWFMDYWNADGSVAEMCGNGVRVFVHFLVCKGLVDLAVGRSLKVGTRAGVKEVLRIADNEYAVDMGPWSFSGSGSAAPKGADALVRTRCVETPRPGVCIDMGNPHTVVMLEAAELAELDLSRPPVISPVAPHGSNTEFVALGSPMLRDGVAQIMMRVYERGVGETYACGTGACAAAVAARLRLQRSKDALTADAVPPDGFAAWDVSQPGGTLRIGFSVSEDGTEHVRLSGPAEIVFDGTMHA